MEDTIGKRIKECRLKMGMTQEDLAAELFTKKSTISAYENDKIDFKVSILKELACKLNTTVSYLVDGNEEKIDSNILRVALLIQGISNKEIQNVAIEQLMIIASIGKKYN